MTDREITVTQTLKIIRCPLCAMVYAVPTDYYNDLYKQFNRGDSPVSFCPVGHSWGFVGDRDIDKLRRERDLAQQANARLSEEIARAERDAQAALEKARLAQSEIDRLGLRAAAGVCPCCNRTFRQLAAHMRAKHPEAAGAGRRSRGGTNRAAALTPERRVEIAKKAAAARWGTA